MVPGRCKWSLVCPERRNADPYAAKVRSLPMCPTRLSCLVTCRTASHEAGSFSYSRVASTVISTLLRRALETGHPCSACFAASAKAAKRESKDGKNVITELKAEGDKSLGRYIYSYKRGILVRRHASRAIVTAQASSTGLAPAHTSSVPLASWGTPVAGQ